MAVQRISILSAARHIQRV
ncbi:hypothetical protein CGLO_12588 [Colletotrichum gloeosporioides Cg-14]|uniref:Uncharacterized protein n=1 Tax=Colletotrichum gloeosporioides (strain Cg-14) TaxID=1237896 RepID=T0JY82_COLGC|nr:hypothetical protein CGLO_12588 [Colletotrichum gloeosporioides Cg-14]